MLDKNTYLQILRDSRVHLETLKYTEQELYAPSAWIRKVEMHYALFRLVKVMQAHESVVTALSGRDAIPKAIISSIEAELARRGNRLYQGDNLGTNVLYHCDTESNFANYQYSRVGFALGFDPRHPEKNLAWAKLLPALADKFNDPVLGIDFNTIEHMGRPFIITEEGEVLDIYSAIQRAYQNNQPIRKVCYEEYKKPNNKSTDAPPEILPTDKPITSAEYRQIFDMLGEDTKTLLRKLEGIKLLAKGSLGQHLDDLLEALYLGSNIKSYTDKNRHKRKGKGSEIQGAIETADAIYNFRTSYWDVLPELTRAAYSRIVIGHGIDYTKNTNFKVTLGKLISRISGEPAFSKWDSLLAPHHGKEKKRKKTLDQINGERSHFLPLETCHASNAGMLSDFLKRERGQQYFIHDNKDERDTISPRFNVYATSLDALSCDCRLFERANKLKEAFDATEERIRSIHFLRPIARTLRPYSDSGDKRLRAALAADPDFKEFVNIHHHAFFPREGMNTISLFLGEFRKGFGFCKRRKATIAQENPQPHIRRRRISEGSTVAEASSSQHISATTPFASQHQEGSAATILPNGASTWSDLTFG